MILKIAFFIWIGKIQPIVVVDNYMSILQAFPHINPSIIFLWQFVCLDFVYISLFSIFFIYILIDVYSNKFISNEHIQEHLVCIFFYSTIFVCLTSLILMLYYIVDSTFYVPFMLCLIHCYFISGGIITGMNNTNLLSFTFTTLPYFVYKRCNENKLTFFIIVNITFIFLYLLSQDPLLCYPPENWENSFLSSNFRDIISEPGAKSIEIVYNQYLLLETYPNCQAGHKPHMYSTFWTSDIANDLYKQHNLTQDDFVLKTEQRKYIVDTFKGKLEFTTARANCPYLRLYREEGEIFPHAKAIDVITLIRKERTITDINAFVSRGGENRSIILERLDAYNYNRI